MAELPVDPMMAKCIIVSEKFKCVEQIIVAIAMLSVGSSIFYRPKEKIMHAENAHKNLSRPGGDHMTLINIFEEWKESGYRTGWCFDNFIQERSMKKARDIKE